MARMHLIQTWTDAAAYSGEQIQNRLSQSQTLHWNRDGTANIHAYAEEPKQKKPPVPINHRISPASKALDKIDKEEEQLEKAIDSQEISLDEYSDLYYILSRKREKAFMEYMKEIGQLEQYMKEQRGEYNKENIVPIVENEQAKYNIRIGYVVFLIVVILFILRV